MYAIFKGEFMKYFIVIYDEPIEYVVNNSEPYDTEELAHHDAKMNGLSLNEYKIIKIDNQSNNIFH